MSDRGSKEPVIEHDLVLVYINNQPAFYARIEGFEPDIKPNWWHVKFLALLFPPQLITWILRREQVNGEPFTMGGTPIRIEKVQVPESQSHGQVSPPPPHEKDKPLESKTGSSEPTRQARILSLGDRKPPDS